MPLTFDLRLTPHRTLQTVLGLRAISIAAQLAVLALAVSAFHLALPVGRPLLGTGFLAAAAVVLAWRLRRSWPVTELEVGLHLLVDAGVLTWLLYCSGGSSNPFVSAYLVPIALAAVGLRPRYGLLVVAACIAAYTLLLRFYVPIPVAHGGPTDGFALHVFGMWANFILSACLIAGVLWVMAENIRRRDRQISEAREAALRNEHVVALGALAAGAAHELSTPLSTAALVADELAAQLGDDPAVQSDLALLKQQIQQCKASLSTLLASADHARVESSAPATVDSFLQQTLERWRVLRPEVRFTYQLTGDDGAALLPEQGLAQALINLLNNAADASLSCGRCEVRLQAHVVAGRLMIEIEDDGPGLADAARELAGRAAVSTKPGGAGLGLLLSNTTLNRWGGTLSLHKRRAGGTLTRVVLPLSRLIERL